MVVVDVTVVPNAVALDFSDTAVVAAVAIAAIAGY